MERDVWSYVLEEFIFQMHNWNVYLQDDTPQQTTKDLQQGQEPDF